MKINRNPNNSSLIEREVRGILNILKAKGSYFVDVELLRPSSSASVVATICAYNRDDYKKRLVDGKLSFTERYVFYADIYNPDKIGSVAIYGRNVVSHYYYLRPGMLMFGRKVKSVRVLVGARPFVDVAFAA